MLSVWSSCLAEKEANLAAAVICNPKEWGSGKHVPAADVARLSSSWDRMLLFCYSLNLDFFSALPTPPNERFLPEGLGIELLTFQQQQEYFIPLQRFAVCRRAGNLSD